MGQLWDIVQSYRKRFEPHPPSIRRIALQIAMSPTALGNWDGELSRLPDRGNLLALADLTGVPYPRVLDAALADAKFLPEASARAEHERMKMQVRDDNRRIWQYIKDTLGKSGPELLAMSAEERIEAAREFAWKGRTRDESWLLTNARQTLLGQGLDLKWLIAEFAEFPEDMSEPSGTTEHLRAAHDEEVSISAEQEGNETP